MSTVFPHYHVGIVVADLEAAMAEYSEHLGVEWRPPVPVQSDLRTEDGSRLFTSRMVYSRQGPPYMELLERRAGTPWSEPGLHHLGLWTPDVESESERLTEAGLPRIISAADHSTGAPFVYHQTADGVRLELIDIGTTGPGVFTYLSGALDDLLSG
ncbi:VOC family protein [Nocardia pseudobrasiliensis]|uniref:Methylmalonyl-CoA/ethylmalonyl-CoA epimerase n=1 Tax=Nocardia pseudobrasiliensis TaxID=45979 RepID=A0A370I196_9NOCA|nr:VOC family protein [Nocardia pseudobrasiliensis]RDI64350.1 methylmalonyl-CoA/ethylmalonyl-CoA epimerase [Nocardia pseudobrasiliensis]